MKKGFTLIEIIIVISIIIVLATLGLGSFTKSQQNMSLDLDADRLVQLLSTYREMSKRSSQCHSLVLESGKTPQHRKAAYLSKKKTCDAASSQVPLAWPSELTVGGLSLDGQAVSAVTLTFLPPLGAIQFGAAGEKGDQAEITLALKNNARLTRSIRVDRVSNSFAKQTLYD